MLAGEVVVDFVKFIFISKNNNQDPKIFIEFKSYL